MKSTLTEYLEAQRIIEEYEKDPSNVRISFKDIPKYVKICGTCLRYMEEPNDFYRDNGDWAINYIVKDGKFYTDPGYMVESLRNQEMIEVSYDEWRKDNDGYI